MASFFKQKRSGGNSLAAAMIWSASFFALFGLFGLMEGMASENPGGIPAQESLVQEGLGFYREGKMEEAEAAFAEARDAYPENPVAPNYLGRIYLSKGRREEAISEWQAYLRLAPEDEDASRIRKYLTLLIREEAIAYAGKALAEEASLPGVSTDERTVAVTDFITMGNEQYRLLGKGISALIVHDLSKVPELQVVERIRIQSLLEEMALGASQLMNQTTAPRVGKLLKARHVAAGSIGTDGAMMQIASALMETIGKSTIKTQEAEGAFDTFYTLEKIIVRRIIEDLGIGDEFPPLLLEEIPTRNLAAFLSFSEGVDYADREQYDKARASLEQAIIADTEFDPAREFQAETPLSGMLGMTAAQMLATLSGEGDAGDDGWLSLFREMLGWGGPSDAALKRAVSLSLMDGNSARACDCLQAAMATGYDPYAVVKTLLEEGGNNLTIEDICACATGAGVMKAVIAKAVTDAATPFDEPMFSMDEIAQCQCLRGTDGLPYTEADALKKIKIDDTETKDYSSIIIP